MTAADVRLERLQRELSAVGAHAMLIRDVYDIEWLTAFQKVFDSERAHTALVSVDSTKVLLHTDSRYIEAARRASAGSDVVVDAEPQGSSEWAHKQAVDNGTAADGANLAIEDSMTLHEYRELQNAFVEATAIASPLKCAGMVNADEASLENSGSDAATDCPRFIETHDVILGLRSVKDDDEIRLLKAAQAVTDRAFDHIVKFMRAGMTEREIQVELDSFMLENGADSLAFPTIVASGPNGALPHAIVSDREIQDGDSIVMDFGAKRDGYCSDMTRTVFVSQPTSEHMHAWEVLRTANETVEERLYVGMTGAEAHDLAFDILVEGGYRDRMGHALGHGVGLQIHELPLLSPKNREPLVSGNVVTVEPGIYIPGEFGMRLEDCGVLTDRGYERFGSSTHDLVVI